MLCDGATRDEWLLWIHQTIGRHGWALTGVEREVDQQIRRVLRLVLDL